MEEDIKNNFNWSSIENILKVNELISNTIMNTPIGILQIIGNKEIKTITYYPKYEKETIIKL